MTSYTYFSKDGSYGDGVGLLLFDTSGWSQKDWQGIEMCSDSERSNVALKIATLKEMNKTGVKIGE